MAPEVILGTPYSFPADVFSFGVTVGEMILREKPQARHPRNAFEFEAGEFSAALPADCPPELSALVLACCAYEPASRPEAKVIVKGLRALHALLAGQQDGPAGDATHEGAGGTTRQARSGSNAAPPAAMAAKPEDAYDGLVPSADDPSPSGLPNEKSAMRAYVAFTCRAIAPEQLLRHRRRWLALQDVPDSALQGWLEIQFPSAKRKSKLYAALVGDVLFYWLKQRKPDVNVGRILVDRSAKVDIEEVGKKKVELRIVGWRGEEFRVHGKRALLEQWCLACKQAQGASSLDLNEVYASDNGAAKRARTHSDLTTSSDVLVFPVVLRGAATGEATPRGEDQQQHPQQVLLCVSTEGVRLCSPFLEGARDATAVCLFVALPAHTHHRTADILFEFSFLEAQKWCIQRNDVCEIVLANAAAKKTLRTTLLEFVCQQSGAPHVCLRSISC